MAVSELCCDDLGIQKHNIQWRSCISSDGSDLQVEKESIDIVVGDRGWK